MKDLLFFALVAIMFSGCAATGTQAVVQHSTVIEAEIADTTAAVSVSYDSTTVLGRWTELKALNPQLAEDDYDLAVDSAITVHEGEVYVVQVGDNLWDIAEQTPSNKSQTDEVDVASMTSAEYVEHIRSLCGSCSDTRSRGVVVEVSAPATASQQIPANEFEAEFDKYMKLLLDNGGRYPDGYFDDTVSSTGDPKPAQVASSERDTVHVTLVNQSLIQQMYWLRLPSLSQVRRQSDSLSRELRLKGLYGFYDRIVPVAYPLLQITDQAQEIPNQTSQSSVFDLEMVFVIAVLILLIVAAVAVLIKYIAWRAEEKHKRELYSYRRAQLIDESSTDVSRLRSEQR